MCGRYFVEGALLDEARLRVFFEQIKARVERSSEQLDIRFEGEVRPADAACAIACNRDLEPAGFAMRWGFENPVRPGLLINARSETASTLPLFSESARQRRCILPASSYFEWGPAEAKKKHAFATASGEPCLLGGLYVPPPAGERLARFVVLTRPAAPNVAHIHHRMPVIIPEARIEDWLSHDVPFASAMSLTTDEVVLA